MESKDPMAVKAGLDIANRLDGSYAAEKVEVDFLGVIADLEQIRQLQGGKANQAKTIDHYEVREIPVATSAGEN